MALGNSDRVAPLKDGTVKFDGFEAAIETVSPLVLFRRTVEEATYDVAEMSASTYTNWVARGDCPYVGLPVFTARAFPQSSIFVADGIEEPAALRGGTVGVFPEYQITTATMVRGLLTHEYDLPPEELSWVTARAEKLPIDPSNGVELHVAPPETNLETLLAAGELDALITPFTPEKLGDGISRLFPSPKVAAKAYYEQTGIFPVIRLLVCKRSVYERHPWVVTALFDAFTEAKSVAQERLTSMTLPPVMLPWLDDHVAETQAALGEDYWPYGLAANYPSLKAFVEYSHEQGLAAKPVAPEDLFAAEFHDR